MKGSKPAPTQRGTSKCKASTTENVGGGPLPVDCQSARPAVSDGDDDNRRHRGKALLSTQMRETRFRRIPVRWVWLGSKGPIPKSKACPRDVAARHRISQHSGCKSTPHIHAMFDAGSSHPGHRRRQSSYRQLLSATPFLHLVVNAVPPPDLGGIGDGGSDTRA